METRTTRDNSAATRYIVPAGRLALRQNVHFIACVVLPSIITVIAPLVWRSTLVRIEGITLFAAMFFAVGCFGVSVGFHRHFSHRSFDAAPWVRAALGALGSMAAQGPLAYWVALHRLHHSRTDRTGDPHSPNLGGSSWGAFVHGHIGWARLHDVPLPSRYARDLQNDIVASWMSASYAWWVVAGLVLPAVFGWVWMHQELGTLAAAGVGLYWGGIARIAVGHQVIWSINSICHRIGARPHSTEDQSTNVAWLSLITFGESWHNNHHQAPTQARFGSGKQVDIGWLMIRCLERLNVAWVRPAGRSNGRP